MLRNRNCCLLWCGAVFMGLCMLLESDAQTIKGEAKQVLSPNEKSALSQFSKSLGDYIAKEHAMPAAKLKPTTNVSILQKEREALRQAIRESRPTAKQGDIFTPEVSSAFRKLLANTMNGPKGREIRASLAHAEPQAPADFSVNAAYPNADGQPVQSVPPTLLLNLPVLPKGLQYCLAGKTLAIRDVDPNMVVDYLPDALP